MSQDSLVNRELVSALADGQLRGDEFARVVAAMVNSDEYLDTWHAYHFVGDVLRRADLASDRDDRAFVARLRVTLLSSVEARPGPEMVTEVDLLRAGRPPFAAAKVWDDIRPTSANDSSMRWKLLAGLASLAAVTAIGWHLASSDLGPAEGARLAVGPGGATTAVAATGQAPAGSVGEPAVMLRDPRLDELMAAHKQFGGTSALQMPAGFLRNATFDNSVPQRP